MPDGAPVPLPPLKALLEAADLLNYEAALSGDLKLRHAADVEFVDEVDLCSIGMSRPEQKRLRREYTRMFPKASFVGKIKKAFSKEENKRNGGDRDEGSQHVIPIDHITLCKELGRGEFGTVHQAYWQQGPTPKDTVQVAVKCISSEKLLSNPASFLSEAAIMHRMHHDDVVRLFGVVLDTRQIMIISELASCGSLLACLQNPALRDSFPVHVLANLTTQIARGMGYLESQRLIHRDLAARNVLVFSSTKVKISDFGLSRSLGIGEEYYKGCFSPTLRLPIAWCAPECINFLKFTHASDVWAFGVTLWEMFSMGAMPWEGIAGAQILEAIDTRKEHLRRPRLCPEDMYSVMVDCWEWEPSRRPSFAALLAILPDRMPLAVRAATPLTSAPDAAHLVYNRDDFIYVINKSPEECPDGSVWLGCMRNGRTGLFDPNNTVAHLGAEPPACNKGELEKEKKKGKEKVDKAADREKRKALISDPVAVRHTAHLGIDGSNFGLLQLDKSTMGEGTTATGPSSLSSPTSAHSSHSLHSTPSTNSLPAHSTTLSPPVPRAPSQPPPISIQPRSATGSMGRGGSMKEPSAPPLTPEISTSDSWSGDSGTTSTSLDTVIGIPRGNGGAGRPVHAVCARGGVHNNGYTSQDTEDSLLSGQLQQLQRELTDFSLCSMGESTYSGTDDSSPLVGNVDPHRHNGLHHESLRSDPSAVRMMTSDEMERLTEKQTKEHRRVDRQLAAEKGRGGPTSSLLPRPPPIDTSQRASLESAWSPEAQEAYRLLVECGTSLRDSVSPSPPSPPRPPSLPPRLAFDHPPPARPPRKGALSPSLAAPSLNYDNLNGIGAGARKPPPVPPKPRVRIMAPANHVVEMEESPTKDDYRADFSSAVHHSSLITKKSREEVLRF